MKNIKAVSLKEVLVNELKDPVFRFHFESEQLYTKAAQLVVLLRKQKGMTQKQLAERVGIPQSMISRLENGDRRRTPTLETLHKILIELGYRLELRISKLKNRAA
jgi:DNA-binding XRE family transcriptional regulator